MANSSTYPGNAVSTSGNVLVELGDGHSSNLEAFGRLRIANPETVFDSQFQYDLQPLIYQALTANGGAVTHVAAEANATLSLDGTASGSAILQSKQYHRYIPGKGQLIVMTGIMRTAVAGVTKRMGYFDADNGIYWEQNGTTDMAIVRRTKTSGSVVNNRAVQSEWNLDKLDGTGPSGLTLDVTKAQILMIDLQWLGMGRVRVGFDIGGHLIYAHEFNCANILTVPYMVTANLPVRWEITGGTIATLKAQCASVQSEGGSDRYSGYNFGYTRASLSAGSSTQTYAFSVRPKATFNSIVNRSLIRPTGFMLTVTGASPVLLEVYYGTTMGGAPSFADMEGTYSGLQVDTAATPSGGFKVAQFFTAASAQAKGSEERGFFGKYPLCLDIAGTGYNHFTVYVTGIGGASACVPGMSWEEVR